jgi:hypothetical protein
MCADGLQVQPRTSALRSSGDGSQVFTKAAISRVRQQTVPYDATVVLSLERLYWSLYFNQYLKAFISTWTENLNSSTQINTTTCKTDFCESLDLRSVTWNMNEVHSLRTSSSHGGDYVRIRDAV